MAIPYFNIMDYNFETDACIKAHQYKVVALEDSNYVGRNYSGAYLTHYSSGFTKIKSYYVTGNLHSQFLYRNDAYNTLEGVRIYNNGILDSEFIYDIRQRLIKQSWYDSSW